MTHLMVSWLIEVMFKQMYYRKLFKVNKNGQRDWKLELSKLNLQYETHL